MPEANNDAQCFYQNLIDIGLEEKMISRCIVLEKEGREKELLMILQNSRRDLLTHIHAEQKKLDCLDYLVKWLDKKGAKK
ncbi:MAG: hypothetical protein LUD12_08620 [Lachnospiraceae bacterium]|nr:hypothetical protein [Lachnospiraceae bacterium]